MEYTTFFGITAPVADLLSLGVLMGIVIGMLISVTIDYYKSH